MRYRFGECVLTLASRELLRGSKVVSIAPQVFDLIAYLITHRGRVISKDELIEGIWGGRIVSDAALTTRVYAARTAIGDNGKQQKFLKTFARRGVRFVGCVDEVGDTPNSGGTGPKVLRTERPVGNGEPVVAVAGFRHDERRPDSESTASTISEEARIELTQFRWLKVIAVATKSITQESKTTDAQYLLQGALRCSGQRCRILVELVDCSAGTNIWAGKYDSSYPLRAVAQRSIVAALVRESAEAIVTTSRLSALAVQSDDLSAWEAYQVGMWHMSTGNPDTIGVAQRSFGQSIECDRRSAAGYSALAWSHMMAASIYSKMTVDEGCEVGRPLILQAMALDESDPEARARLALLEFLSGDLAGGIEEANAVLAIKPDCASALGVKGAALISSGRHASGRAALEQFLRLSPNDPVRSVRLTQIAISHYLDRNYVDAARIAKQVTRRFPMHPFAYRWLAAALGQLNRRDEAMLALHALREKWPDSFEMYVAKEPPTYCSAEYKPLLSGLRKAGWAP